MSYKTKALSNTVSFTLGQEFEEKQNGGKVVKVRVQPQNAMPFINIVFLPEGRATFDGTTLTIVTQTEKGEIRRSLEFTETGIEMVSTGHLFTLRIATPANPPVH